MTFEEWIATDKEPRAGGLAAHMKDAYNAGYRAAIKAAANKLDALWDKAIDGQDVSFKEVLESVRALAQPKGE